MQHSQLLPVHRRVDILVFGADTSSIAAAEAAARRGANVLAISDLSYFGAESAGTLNLLASPVESKSHPIFSAAAAPFSRPLALKSHLEQVLIDTQIPFLYHCRPIGLLRNARGRIAGAVFAARTSIFGILCNAMVDTSRSGLLAGLSGKTPRIERTPLPFAWNVLVGGNAPAWPGSIGELPCDLGEIPESHQQHNPRMLRLELSPEMMHEASQDPAAALHIVRASFSGGFPLVSADLLNEEPFHAFSAESSLADSPNDLDPSSFEIEEGLWLAGPALPLAARAARELLTTPASAAMGEKVGLLAAGQTAGLPLPDGSDIPAASCPSPLQFAPVFLRSPEAMIPFPELPFSTWESRDVVVAGGGTAGAPAGISASRAGANTLLLEQQSALGGVGTIGLIASYWFGNRTGFCREISDAVAAIDPFCKSKKGNAWYPEAKMAVLHEMLRTSGATAWMGSHVCGVSIEGDRLASVLVSTPYGCGIVSAGCFVDATGNADLAAAGGAPCRVMDASHVAVQGTGLSPKASPFVRNKNSDHTFVDDNDPEGITFAHVNARRKFPTSFDTSNLVDSRERRQIHGEFEVSPLDILALRTFPDTVFTAQSNFDTHGFIIHPVFMVAPPNHEPLRGHVPLRCLLPRGLRGLLVTGLGMSAHRDALPLLRMQPDLQNQGFSAGLAAARCARDRVDPRELDIRDLQSALVEAGVLEPEVALHDDSFPLSTSTILQSCESDLTDTKDVAVLFAHPAVSKPELEKILESNCPAAQKENAALILGLLGDATAAPFLLDLVASTPWEDGWNYRGMGQFGASMSRIDTMVIALSTTRNPDAAAVIAGKAWELPEEPAFSHCRAIALAAINLRAPVLSEAIVHLLGIPGIRGHVRTDLRSTVEQANEDPVETADRNGALRELHLARGLFLCGDIDDLGKSILEEYSQDLRGHFARHARAVLELDPSAPISSTEFF